VYRKIYRDKHGDGPYICDYCDKPMDELEMVHHVDEDPWNNHISNLVSVHTECHNKLHHLGLMHTDEVKKQIGTTLKQRYDEGSRLPNIPSGEDNPFFGRRHTNGTKKAIGDAQRRLRQTCSCGLSTNPGNITRHQLRTGHIATR
jgi:hypothetical protein